MNRRHGPGDQKKIRFLRDHKWKLYETGELHDLQSDPDEDVPIYEIEDSETQSAARKRLQPIFSQMVN
jgi:hypothetical protein